MTTKSGDKTTKKCLYCHTTLTGKQRNYCSDAHRKAHKRQEERIENLPPQAQISLNPDNLRIPDIDLSALASDFTETELMDFAAHILAMAEYEHVWYERTLSDLSHAPGQKHINDPIPPDYRRVSRILEKYQRSEAIFRWIGDKVQEAIGRKVKAYRSPCYGGMEFQIIDGKTVII